MLYTSRIGLGLTARFNVTAHNLPLLLDEPVPPRLTLTPDTLSPVRADFVSPSPLPEPQPATLKQHQRKLGFRCYIVLALVGMVAVVLYEGRTSIIQAALFTRYAAQLSYTLEAGPSTDIRYPKEGPFDIRMGYVHLPQMLERLQSKGLEIEQQARFSPALMNYTADDLFTPFTEKDQAGLDVADCRGESLYTFRYPRRGYAGFEAVPALVVQALLFIENRELLDPTHVFVNPAVDWGRFTKAGFTQVGNALGMELPAMGGSTLATQIEKYRHSGDGVTASIDDKLRQMLSASVRAYHKGPETLPLRRELVVSYLNTVPLSAAPGHGEVHGLGDGLWVWLGADFETVNRLLNQPDGEGAALAAKALALRQVLALMIAHRRPSYYLIRGRAELASLVGSYLRLMASAGTISLALRDAALQQQSRFRDFKTEPVPAMVPLNKGANLARYRLVELLDTSLYALDRMDLAVSTTLHGELQEKITDYLLQLNDPDFAKTAGVVGHRLLPPDRTRDVRYSFTLFERTAQGNRVRVQTDNTRQPFDINESSKLELGSTAKLRVLATYLEVVAELHWRYAGESADNLRRVPAASLDPLSRWALDYLANSTDRSLPAMLREALNRRYSASPYERFFTGGGVQRFKNFRPEDDKRRPSVREALRDSINLAFVRIMRDLVQYTIYQNVQGSQQILREENNPRRKAYLSQFADREGQIYLHRFWRKYQGKMPEERLEIFLEGLYKTPVRLAAAHRYLYPEADEVGFGAFLNKYLPEKALGSKEITRLYRQYGPGTYNLPDQGYLARVHPLELWLLAYLQRYPGAKLEEALDASYGERQEVYAWLFRTRAKNTQDSRIRIMLEVEAFSDIHQRWKRLGYPFNHLIPSLGSALGSSGDRPTALAELVGIILNDGIRQPAIRIDSLRFAAGTPYETSLKQQPVIGVRVMEPAVSAALREVLAEVVENGTARRLQGGFSAAGGAPMAMGGKTGTGDNRIRSTAPGSQHLQSRTLNRTATFVFYLGSDHFGTLTAFVPGSSAADYSFTSALPVQVLRGMAPILQPYLEPESPSLCAASSL